MFLREVKNVVPVEVLRDGEFLSLGFLTHATPQKLTFLEDERFRERLLANPVNRCVMTTPQLAARMPGDVAVAVTPEPRRHFYELHNHLVRATDFYWTDFPSEIAPSARIHPSAHVASRNVRIGADVVIEPGAVVLEKAVIGDGSIVRACVTVSTEGFEFKRLGHELLQVAHGGGARLGRRCEIQSHSNVDRSVFGGYTEIGDDTKIDAYVHIGHNVTIGRRTMIAATTVLAGSSTIGDEVWIGPHSIISSEVHVGDRARITLGSVVTRDVAPGARVTGNFAIDHEQFVRNLKRAATD